MKSFPFLSLSFPAFFFSSLVFKAVWGWQNLYENECMHLVFTNTNRFAVFVEWVDFSFLNLGFQGFRFLRWLPVLWKNSCNIFYPSHVFLRFKKRDTTIISHFSKGLCFKSPNLSLLLKNLVTTEKNYRYFRRNIIWWFFTLKTP